jgi:type IV secretion system protein VirB9
MRALRSFVILLAASFACVEAALAQATMPDAGPVDPRMRVITYDPDQVVALAGHLGYQMMIEFAEGELIENVSIGDSVSWQITPNRRANLLFIKPVERHAATNMTVVTNLRRYAFELRAYDAGRAENLVTYNLRFIYPEPPAVLEETAPVAAEPDLAALNFNYSFSGARAIIPAKVFDDGRFTFFEFAEGLDSPAIFVIGPDGGEELVNNQVRGRYTVVDRVAEEFVLRYGRSRTRVHNNRISSPRRLWPFGGHNQEQGG